jgi:hypothetical protein
VPGRWHEQNSVLRNRSFGVTCEPHTYLVLSAWYTWTDTFVCGGKTAVIVPNMLAATIEKLDTQVTWRMGFLRCWAIWTRNINFCLNFGITLYLELTYCLESYNMVTRICFSKGSCFRVDHLHGIKLSDGTISCCTTWLLSVIPVFCMGISLMVVSFLLTSYYLTHHLNCFQKFEFKPVTK